MKRIKQEIINLYQSDKYYKTGQIATLLNLSTSTVRRTLKKANIELEQRNWALPLKTRLLMCEDYNSGQTFNDLVDKYKCTRMSIWRMLQHHGIKCRNAYTEANIIKRSKVDKLTLTKICSDYLNGIKIEDLALKYNYSNNQISSILKRYNISTGNYAQRGGQKYTLKEDLFKHINDEASAYWMGFIAADGCVSPKELSIGLAIKDLDHLKLFKEYIESNRPISILKKISGDKYRPRDMCAIRVGSQDVCDNLVTNGLSYRKTHKLKLPNIKASLMHHFIRGYFDGDGNIYMSKDNKKFQWQIISTERFCIDVQNVLINQLNLSKTKLQDPNPDRNNNIRRLRWGGPKATIKLYYYMYKDANILLKRKKDYYDNIIKIKETV